MINKEQTTNTFDCVLEKETYHKQQLEILKSQMNQVSIIFKERSKSEDGDYLKFLEGNIDTINIINMMIDTESAKTNHIVTTELIKDYALNTVTHLNNSSCYDRGRVASLRSVIVICQRIQDNESC